MKKIILILIITFMIFTFFTCSKTKKGIDNYYYMYDVIDDWNKQASPGHKREDLFGFGEYLYNSYLILFPREKPQTLTDFYFFWEPLIDVDLYAAYFTCQLNDDSFPLFVDGLNKFTVKNSKGETKLLYDNENFDYNAYIIQWKNPNEKWEVLEYILLDEENHVVIFVYTMGGLSLINEYASYNILPKNIMSDDLIGFSIYENFEESTYDLSFLNYLN